MLKKGWNGDKYTMFEYYKEMRYIFKTRKRCNQLVSMIESLVHKLEKINQGRIIYSHSLNYQIKISCVSNDLAFKLSTSHDKKKKNKITCTLRKNPTLTFKNKTQIQSH